MGQTLTHGIYLPDEGERNCYNGLAANWSILDGAVGTIAEHTSALAGKAPLVHTHTKSDITDLFNSANTWSGDNTFSGSNSFKNITLSATMESIEIMHNTWHGYEQYYTRGTINYPNYDTFLKWNSNRYDNTIGLYRSVGVLTATTEGATVNDIDESFAYYIYHINAKYVDFMGNIRITNDGTYNFLAPLSYGDTSLGTSTNQWNNLYAKNYYYNGTAWGLDKANTWTGVNTFSGAKNSIIFLKFGTSGAYNDIRYFDNNDLYYATIRCQPNFLSLGVKHSSASSGWYNGSSISILNDGSVNIKSYDGTDARNTYFTNNAVYPSASSVTELGTSTNRWKTLNGINPGALSIFNPSASYDPIDIPTSWDTSGASWNTLSVSNLGDGWVCITYNNCSADDYILVRFGGTSGARYPSLRFGAVKNSDNKYYIYALFPVAKAFSNIYLEMLINSNANLVIHHYIPAYGTV